MSKYKDLNDFLIKHNANKETPPTHTRIGDKQYQVYGGSFSIPVEDESQFYRHFYDKVFFKGQSEYLTEKQLCDGCSPIAVDFDFRYDPKIESRQHTPEHVQDIVMLYLEELKGFYTFGPDAEFPVYVMEKPNVNMVADKGVTKDGIHMIIGVQSDHVQQQMIRERVLAKLPDVWDGLPITNSWASVLDEGISKGTTNWQLYGCKKPGNEAYRMTYHFDVTFDPSDSEFMIEQKKTADFDMSINLYKLSVRYPNHPRFPLSPATQEEYLKMKNNTNPKKSIKSHTKAKLKLLCDEEDGDDFSNNEIPLSSITNKDILVKAVNQMLTGLSATEHYVQETHDYTQILPEKYYEPGSHLLNRKIAFGLKDTDDRLFLSWVLLRSNADDFDYDSIPQLYTIWNRHIKNEKHSERITRRSIMYWARQDAPEEYQKVRENTIDAYIEETLASPTDYDFGMVLYCMYKGDYVCVSMVGKPIWYVYEKHRWRLDGGESLRLKISRDMHSIYQRKIGQYTEELRVATDDQDQDRIEACKKKVKYVSELQIRLKNTSHKNNIMKEASNIFYDENFIKYMDTNKHLLCFNNGVVDFKEKCFRPGCPYDYITKSTGVDYKKLDSVEDDKKIAEITTFMEMLFPVETLCTYMWEHLASCLIGTNVNQTFNIYRGSGSNGKSKLVELMNHVLGDYAGTVPITLVSDRRPTIGGTSSEVVQLKGLRYAVMQEPSKDTRLNEGVMKELTGGDKIQARALYSASETFTLQLKLCVCTNSLFEINSNDDGTWRRIRIVDFMSKFVDKIDKTEEDEYQFLKDKTLDDKLSTWAQTFAAMLVERAFKTEGHVNDCDIVLASSNRYRQGQDHIAAFVEDMIIRTGVASDKVGKKELANEFKVWFQEHQGVNRKTPKGTEVYEYMEKKFGKWKSTGWSGIKIAYPETSDDLVELSSL